MFQYVLFDLDGTLTDPREGITKSVQFALAQQGISEPDLKKLEPFIGPPLKDSFMEFYGMTEEQAAQGVADYRKRFAPIGKFENEVYPGIPEMLGSLKRAGIRLAVASSKPETFVWDILKYFKLDGYFDVVTGSELDGTRSRKEEVVEEALHRLELDGQPVSRENCAMVGDRRFDIEGGRQFQLTTVGVTYGYAAKGELEAAGADYIVKNPVQLTKLLLGECGAPAKRQGGAGEKSAPAKRRSAAGERGALTAKQGIEGESRESAFLKTWNVLAPLIVYYVGFNLGYMMIAAGIQVIAGKGGTSQAWLYDNSVLILSLCRMCSMIAGMAAVFPMFRKETADWEGSMKLPVLTVGILAVSMALGTNILFSLLHITELSKSFADVAGQQFLVPVWQGLLLFGVISPFTEEIVFRGVIYNRLKKYFPVWIAILTSAVLFGGYHGNLVQGIYGFLLGTVIAWLYEVTGSFRIPVMFHAFANISVFLLTYNPDIAASINTWINFLIFAIISISTLFFIKMRKKN